MSRTKKTKKKISAASVVEIILIAILVLVMLIMLGLNFLFKKDNSAVSFLGYSFYNTKAVTMLPDFPVNTVVIAKASEKANIKENSVVLCNIGENTALIRVVRIEQEDDGTYYVVKYDTAPENDTARVKSDAVIAKAIWQINGLGSFLKFAKSTVGIIIAVIIPLIFIIAIQVARILGIRRLEDEAASLDDIDGFIRTRDEEEPAAVTFTEPKFLEDVTGKLPKVGHSRDSEPKIEKILSFDSRGRAEYTERPADPKPQKQDPLFTYDRLTGAKAPREEAYMNPPTKIEADNKPDALFEKYAASGKGQPVVFTPHLSNIIPDSIAAVQEETAAVRKPAPEEGAKTYFEKDVPPVQTVLTTDFSQKAEKPAIPEKAVLPKETIAPPKKQKNSKALAELMNIIDAEESKLKK